MLRVLMEKVDNIQKQMRKCILKSRDITLLTKVHLVKAMISSSSHVWMWGLDYKESWVPKNWCFRTVVLEKTLENPLNCREIKPVNPKGNQTWIFIGRTDAEAEFATQFEELTYWKRPWCWQRWEAGGEGEDRGWDVWMASLTQWTWVWTSSGSWWRTGKPAVLQSWGRKSQTQLSDWTEGESWAQGNEQQNE